RLGEDLVFDLALLLEVDLRLKDVDLFVPILADRPGEFFFPARHGLVPFDCLLIGSGACSARSATMNRVIPGISGETSAGIAESCGYLLAYFVFKREQVLNKRTY